MAKKTKGFVVTDKNIKQVLKDVKDSLSGKIYLYVSVSDVPLKAPVGKKKGKAISICTILSPEKQRAVFEAELLVKHAVSNFLP